MKDLYSFSRNKGDHEKFYEKMKDAYMQTFGRMGMKEKTYITISSGGSFSKYSYEFQTLSEAGEDEIYIIDEGKKLAINRQDFNEDILKDFKLNIKKEKLVKKKSIEVGDIYSLGYKYSEAFDLKYKNEKGEDEMAYMGSYGMSPTRLMGAIVELNNDEKGIIWPKSVAPFQVHLLSLGKDKEAEKIYKDLEKKNIDVLFDDRNTSAGEKFADADLIGIPYRVVVSEKALNSGGFEVKKRSGGEKIQIMTEKELTKILTK
jgi:prolyl-tRNA synthetase